MTAQQQWMDSQGPGISLTQRDASEPAPTLATAVPVFVGWAAAEAGQPAPGLYTLPAWEACLPLLSPQAPVESSMRVTLVATMRHYFDNGGGPCRLLLIGAPPPLEPGAMWPARLGAWFDTWSAQPALFAPLLQEPAITLVAMPQLSKLFDDLRRAGYESEQTKRLRTCSALQIQAWNNLLAVCAERTDLFFVLDAPAEPELAKACLEQLRRLPPAGARGQHAALYGPYLLTDYPAPDAEQPWRLLPPCGAVLGSMARTDAAHGIWKAPANEPLARVIQPQYRQAQGWFDPLALTINPIRGLPGRGVRVWGCRTLLADPGSPLRYVQVRRLVSWIEGNLKELCRFAVFEPNGEITWFHLRGLCAVWLRRLWQEGGLRGTEEAQAFSVRVGLHESMTAADLADGRLIVKVAVAVLRPAEFIDISLLLRPGEGTSPLALVAITEGSAWA